MSGTPQATLLVMNASRLDHHFRFGRHRLQAATDMRNNARPASAAGPSLGQDTGRHAGDSWLASQGSIKLLRALSGCIVQYGDSQGSSHG